MEASSGILAGIVAWKFGFGGPAAAALVFTWILLAASIIDFRHQLLPDDLILPLLWLGLVAALFGLFADLPSAVIGAMAGYLSLWSVYQIFRLLTGKEGMGHGDFKLLAALGAWTGWQYLVTIVILSSLVGAVFGLALILFRGRDPANTHAVRSVSRCRRLDRAAVGRGDQPRLPALARTSRACW
ncbi:MAG: A24 family peptidase [Chromatiales bacterium]|nr:A24 family peptidase [Chromatiales bacterium]